MSILSTLFGGGSKTSQSTSTTSTKTMDQRVGVEGGLAGGQLVGPEANVANPGSIATRVGDFSQVTQTITGNKFRVGMTGGEVKELLNTQATIQAGNLGVVKDFASSSLNAVAAAQQGRTTEWQQYIPVIIIGLVAAAAVTKRKGRKA